MIEEEKKLREQLALLKDDVRAKWVKTDNLPYIHATNDPNPKPYSSPVVGRFDYMETADYVLACNPVAMTAILAELNALRSK